MCPCCLCSVLPALSQPLCSLRASTPPYPLSADLLFFTTSNANASPDRSKHARPHRNAGEVAVQLLHLFAEVTAAAIAAQAPSLAAHPAGLLSPILRSNTAMSVARATQVAAARALGRVSAASACCRSTLIRVVRDSQLLVQLLPALRCPLTMDELEVRVRVARCGGCGGDLFAVGSAWNPRCKPWGGGGVVRSCDSTRRYYCAAPVFRALVLSVA